MKKEGYLIDSKVVVGISEFRDFCDYGKIDGIIYLNFDGWGLESIPQEVFELKNLKSLSLEFNQITEIPKDISNLTSLKYLDVDYNQLTVLPEIIGEMRLLKSLGIMYNNISSLPISIKNLKNLKHIYLRGTKITQAPEFLKDWALDELTKTISPHIKKD
ncbi:MAG TPA: leucine-rich repeat domain-containing protein [bacterium]|nr:leucine-rich repeat domain-containing protein [bacterium]